MQRIAFIIPAAGQKASLPQYQEIGQYFGQRSIAPAYIEINWRMRQSIEDCAQEAEKQIHAVNQKYPDAELYFFGFSIGAMVAMLLSAHYEAKAQILCSMPAFFKEDKGLLPWHYRLSSNFLIYPGADKPKYPSTFPHSLIDTFFLLGEKEEKFLTSVVKDYRQKKYEASKTILVPNVGHNSSQPEYLQAIKAIISRF